jgi:hypothetical protein
MKRMMMMRKPRMCRMYLAIIGNDAESKVMDSEEEVMDNEDDDESTDKEED